MFTPTRRLILAAAGAATFAPNAYPGETGDLVLRAAPSRRTIAGDAAFEVDLELFEGQMPGPIMRVVRGRQTTLELVNGLPRPLSFVIEGIRSPDALIGPPHPRAVPLAPGETRRLALDTRDAGTFFYRAFDDMGWANGLCGLLIVDDAGPPIVDQDIVLLAEVRGPAGRRSATMNGARALSIAARAGERLRLRVANGAPFNMLGIVVEGPPIVLVALDGQPSEPFALANGTLVLGPGQRADLMIDLPPTSRRAPIRFTVGAETIEGAIEISEGVAGRAPRAPIAPLPDNPIAKTMDFRRAHRLALSMTGAAFAGATGAAPGPAPLFRVRRGTVVMAGLANETNAVAAVTLHGHAMRLLDGLDDGWKPFFLGACLIAAGRAERVAFQTEAPGRYPITARIMGDPASTRVVWFEVT